MKHKLLIILLGLTTAATFSYADAGHKIQTLSLEQNNVQPKLVLLTKKLIANKPNTVVFSLITANGRKLTDKDLQVVHTKQVHILILDPSYTEYQHLHPDYIGDGKFKFTFTPKSTNLHIWADVTVNGDIQYYTMSKFGNVDKPSIKSLTSTNSYQEDGYQFNLSLDNTPSKGEMSMGKIIITKDGQPVTNLQEIMGAYAHVLVFADDYKTLLHVHPMENDSEKQGIVEFHLEPEQSGFAKMFAQIKINDKEYIVPFNLNIKQ